ncbi:MAG: hypothetical protein P9M15_01550, partial [Candidatus Electryoneaceae bacterium]|nr:hypothetical protein [Candidatus Electryoneaceae bacterium]
GVDLTNGKVVDIGEAVGVIAAQAIGEPGTQLTLRTFHIGGTASLIAAESSVPAKSDGRVVYKDLHGVKMDDGSFVVLRRNGIIKLIDDQDRIIARYSVPYAAVILNSDGSRVKEKDILFRWEPYSASILADSDGTIEFHDIEMDMTMIESTSDVTGGRRQKMITESKDRRLNPHILIIDKKGKTGEQYILPIGAILEVEDGAFVKAGTVLVKIPKAASKTKDITGGLPRVAELFEARRPKEPATVTEIDGVIKFGDVKRGMREILVIPSDPADKRKYGVPVGRYVLVHEGEYVRAGERLVEGAIAPHDILAILGPRRLQEYMVNEIQDVYRLQGVRINDKHIEVIVRQMMQKVRVEDPGDTTYLEGDRVDFVRLSNDNEKLKRKLIIMEQGDSKFKVGAMVDSGAYRRDLRRSRKNEGQEPTVRPTEAAKSKQILLGITQASLATESFISAASFQETTRVLTEAAIARRTDILRGLKENVIMGHLIPAGTGIRRYRSLAIAESREEEKPTPLVHEITDFDGDMDYVSLSDQEQVRSAEVVQETPQETTTVEKSDES